MKQGLRKLLEYLPDRTVLDERPVFDEDISQPFFHQGNRVGCLVLHGVGGTPANVRVLSDRLAAEGYTVFAPMLPGHGETVRALNASTGAEWLACALAGYEKLLAAGCQRICPLGLSLGGLLAGLVAEERPCDGLVMICAPIKMRRFLQLARLLSPVLPFARYPSGGKSSSRQNNPYAQMYAGFSTLKLWDLTRLSRRLRRDLQKITCPALWISAEYDDKVAPVSFDIFRNGAVNAGEIRHVHMAESGHGCTYGRERERVAALAADFLKSIGMGGE